MKSNVCYNLAKSVYQTTFKQYTFYFSSEFNKQRFDTQIQTFIENETLKLNAKYRTTFNAEIVISLYFYRVIEKRGFYVIDYNGLPVAKDYEVVMEII